MSMVGHVRNGTSLLPLRPGGRAIALDRPSIFPRPLDGGGLRDSHILAGHSESVSGERCRELVPAISHGLGSRGFVVAVPAAETGDDPRDEGKGGGRMRVFLAVGLAFELSAEALKGEGESVVDDVAGRSRAAISSIDQLNGSDSPGQGDGGEIE